MKLDGIICKVEREQMGNNRKILNDNLFSVWTLILVFIGLALNFCFSKLTINFKLPLYLDSIGTIVTSIFGGHLPGIIVGSLSNVINSTSNPITLFYGFISVLFALLTSYLAKLGTFRSWKKALLSIFLYAFIGVNNSYLKSIHYYIKIYKTIHFIMCSFSLLLCYYLI